VSPEELDVERGIGPEFDMMSDSRFDHLLVAFDQVT